MSSYRLSRATTMANRYNTTYRQSAPAISTAVESVGSRTVQHGVVNGDRSGFARQMIPGFPRPAHQHPSPLGHGFPAYTSTSVQHDVPLDLSRSSQHGSASMANRPLDLSRPSPPDLASMTNAAPAAEAQTSIVNVPRRRPRRRQL